ncbi:hypothetical protein JKP88DRAFT_271084 [Tribonema minus]|uniref:HECT-type E3 ubiquitin transferase n=1 Tax=Tribonema minus TaxID=303371 RepID=A0A835YG59_9STRA|nr:hypothetical protein JKP88DRAFT_271084 [Tribonema minus]
MAPEVEAGGAATRASDMYSLGCLLFWLHFPDHPTGPVAGAPIRASGEAAAAASAALMDLLHQLLQVRPASRPSASDALLHAYFQVSFVDRLLEDGAVPEQHAKLAAMRALFARVREASRRAPPTRWMLRRGATTLVSDVLAALAALDAAALRAPVRIAFAGEAGVDEGGMLSEALTLFFEVCARGMRISARQLGSSNGSSGGSCAAAAGSYLPAARAHYDPAALRAYELLGRAVALCLYSGRRVGGALAPSLFRYLAGGAAAAPTLRDLEEWDPAAARGLRWLLACEPRALRGLGLSFEDVGDPGGGAVTAGNRAQFVQAKVRHILVASREAALAAAAAGVTRGLADLSPEAPSLMRLLAPADWRVLLCGDTHVSSAQVVSALRWYNFPPASGVPRWLPALLLSLGEDTLRRFLVFVCGSPSLPPASGSGGGSSGSGGGGGGGVGGGSGGGGGFAVITVRCQPRSAALPVAHTCFLHLDVPDYASEAALRRKLLQAVTEAATFDLV